MASKRDEPPSDQNVGKGENQPRHHDPATHDGIVNAAGEAARKSRQKYNHELEIQKQRDHHAHEHATLRAQLGWLGLVFGGSTQSITNIVAFVVVALAAMIAWSIYLGVFKDVGQPLLASMGLALGYLFGKGSSGRRLASDD
jgi:hypothetical protein